MSFLGQTAANIGGAAQNLGGQMGAGLQQLSTKPIVDFLREHPISYENIRPGGGGFGFSTQPLADQYQKQLQQEALNKLTNTPMTREEQTNMLLSNPVFRDEAIKAAMKQYFYVPSELDRALMGASGKSVAPPRNPFPQLTTIKVISPNGEVGEIPAEDWAEAQMQGYRRAE